MSYLICQDAEHAKVVDELVMCHLRDADGSKGSQWSGVLTDGEQFGVLWGDAVAALFGTPADDPALVVVEGEGWEAVRDESEGQTVRLYLCDSLEQAHDISLAMGVTLWRDFDGPNGTRYAVEVPDDLVEHYPDTIQGSVLVRENGKFISGNWEPYEP